MTSEKKLTLESLREHKRAGRKISVLTCYDALTARAMESAGVEVLLVGDTAAEVVLGLPGTRGIPPEFMLTLTSAVRRGAPQSLVMGDLPFGCRTAGDAATIAWARRFMDETGCDFLKVEVTAEHVQLIEGMVRAGVPVVAHLGLLPQMIEPGEAYSARGRDAQSAREVLADARRFESAGSTALLLEAVASEVAREVTTHTELPVIGCVSGPNCDGTVVVLHDMIGWGGGHPPKMIKRYGDLAAVLRGAFEGYVADIHAGAFPSEQQAIHMRPGELEKLMASAKG
jgi:3-methyl-2-oxobutanoate hydroxymethyltransferase